MRLVLCVVALASFLAAEEPAFDVKEIAPEQVQKINNASRELEYAMTAFTDAQKRLDAAKAAKDKAVSEASRQFSAFDGPCNYPVYGSGVTANAIYISPTKSFRRVEIRGKFALITTGIETCGAGIVTWSGATTTTLPTISTTTSITNPTY